MGKSGSGTTFMQLIYTSLIIFTPLTILWGFLGGSDGRKNLPPMQETRAQSLSWEDPLEKETASHFSILAWRISWTEEPGGLQSMGSQRVRPN